MPALDLPGARLRHATRHPWFWTIVDLSFGVFGLTPLVIAYRLIKRIVQVELPGRKVS